MSWEAIGTFALVLVTFVGVNIGALQWLLQRHAERAHEDAANVADIQKQLFDLRAELPLEYVRRDDWIRFSATLDAKLDRMRDEIREEIAEIKGRADGRI